MKALLLFLILSLRVFGSCSGSGVTWSCTAGSTSSQIQTALNSASDGATITFDAGSYTPGGMAEFDNSKGATLICATEGGCTINTGNNTIFGMSTLSGDNNKFYRISGFAFVGSGGGPGVGIIWFHTDNGTEDSTLRQFRIDHNTFTNYAEGEPMIFLGHNTGIGRYYGLIDHNTLTNALVLGIIHMIGIADPTPVASTYGTGDNLFIEDNVLNFTSLPNLSTLGCSDAWGGATYVIRHNTSTNCLWAFHGVDHGGGAANVEFYNNSVNITDSDDAPDCYRCYHHQGGGTQIFFNNTFTPESGGGHNSEVMITQHYRSGTSSPLGQCDGTKSDPADGNRSPEATYRGYPCWHQPGRDFAANAKPIYAWNNKWGDDNTKASILLTGTGGSPDYSSNHMVANRDYFDAVSINAQTSATSPFDGTIGMGFGTLANRPTTCTTGTEAADSGLVGVGYFATDDGAQGTLYRCSATNTWTAHYTPYTYPHPLQGAASSSPSKSGGGARHGGGAKIGDD